MPNQTLTVGIQSPPSLSQKTFLTLIYKNLCSNKETLHQKIKFSIKYFFSKCAQIRRKLRICSHLLKKSLMENFIFCAYSFKPGQVIAQPPSKDSVCLWVPEPYMHSHQYCKRLTGEKGMSTLSHQFLTIQINQYYFQGSP